ncbi:uncharacterized protein LOC106093888 [Stomoxys calcitrans]|uniref:uncharacterized protein LOC106093888 n=1 Tax=Stomoxys calcitrans TaxID=35570 RepID=UPI0027E21D6B|nr:uncharacterized protein LOC106093888 [Stomoxys calcitrans]XP_059217006.1 uncharacterized protein LOC106093888 [Stomoxys calcitrans]XP_059217007.1 uncharacterized protein LOC106093888 [Stomoxys calcitrans]
MAKSIQHYDLAMPLNDTVVCAKQSREAQNNTEHNNNLQFSEQNRGRIEQPKQSPNTERTLCGGKFPIRATVKHLYGGRLPDSYERAAKNIRWCMTTIITRTIRRNKQKLKFANYILCKLKERERKHFKKITTKIFCAGHPSAKGKCVTYTERTSKVVQVLREEKEHHISTRLQIGEPSSLPLSSGKERVYAHNLFKN